MQTHLHMQRTYPGGYGNYDWKGHPFLCDLIFSMRFFFFFTICFYLMAKNEIKTNKT